MCRKYDKQTKQFVEKRAKVDEVIVRGPYAAVKMKFVTSDKKRIIGVGFAKFSTADQKAAAKGDGRVAYDPQRGITIATGRAIADICEQLIV